ncbi:MAG: hypothetical protein HP490_14195 [Nitrospira sp.]|nr:hypothetical protein [Nitrospira sp.]
MIIGIVLLGLLLTATTVSAEKAITLHVVGTVTAIDTKHIAVKTTGKTAPVSVKLTDQVRFKDKNNRPGSNEPPVVGDHVIIEAKKENKALFATVVHYSAMRKATAPLSSAAP